MKKNLRFLVYSGFTALSFLIPPRVLSVDGLPFEKCPPELKLSILKYATSALLDTGTVGKLPVVCKEWQSIVKDHKIDIFTFAICEVFPIDKEICKRFLNGKLVYKPNADNDIGKVELYIKELANPLEGAFDLSRLGNTGKYLNISTGYRMGKKLENKNKIEVWLAPRFLVEKEINGRASHLKSIFPYKWPTISPIGIFWTWGNWEDIGWCDYLTNQSMDEISDHNLYHKYVNHSSNAILSSACLEAATQSLYALQVQFMKGGTA